MKEQQTSLASMVRSAIITKVGKLNHCIFHEIMNMRAWIIFESDH